MFSITSPVKRIHADKTSDVLRILNDSIIMRKTYLSFYNRTQMPCGEIIIQKIINLPVLLPVVNSQIIVMGERYTFFYYCKYCLLL